MTFSDQAKSYRDYCEVMTEQGKVPECYQAYCKRLGWAYRGEDEA